MPTKNKVATKYYVFFGKIDRYDVLFSSNINHDIDNRHQQHDEMEVFHYLRVIKLQGTCIESDERDGDRLYITLYGEDRGSNSVGSTLADHKVLDKDGIQKWRKIRGESFPVYDPPDHIGHIDKVRGENAWNIYLWLPDSQFDRIAALLYSGRQTYAHLNELQKGRHKFLRWIELSTEHPAGDEVE
ncbi:MAG: hypothetical protein H8D24_05695 [Gammaproteobacteria bacterium]|uniref:Uncharacterized protein n=1 Tax=Candidatus Thiopontia autotrophica TaxID=2841688 RepID=A0A8J6PE84_9GAMM|nr:hypothetical protein [Candidatus Thiopontia autotrophica]